MSIGVVLADPEFDSEENHRFLACTSQPLPIQAQVSPELGFAGFT
jgi:hypothetical protein